MANEKPRFAAALNEQGRFAQTCVGDFTLLPEVGRHVWKGKFAENAAELTEQVNGALKSIADFGDPFMTLEVVAVGEIAAEGGSQKSEIGSEIILEANQQLLSVIEANGVSGKRKLQPREAAVA
jgi:hypothetical protein